MPRNFLQHCACIRSLGFLLVFCVPAIRLSAVEGVSVVLRTNYYDFRGTKPPTLIASANQQRPRAGHAYTHWQVEWKYALLPSLSHGECQMHSFEAKVQVRYLLPKWSDMERADPAMRLEWKRYVESLMGHESGHSDIGVAAAHEMVRVMKSRPWRAADRYQLKGLIDAECQRILKEYREREVAYDQKTAHGRTQGARFHGFTGLAIPRHTSSQESRSGKAR